MNDYKTKISCFLTGCKYNSACCDMTNKPCYCTCNQIDFVQDPETGLLDCKQYEYDYNKPYMCICCQLEQYGEIDITPEPQIEELVEVDLDDLFK